MNDVDNGLKWTKWTKYDSKKKPHPKLGVVIIINRKLRTTVDNGFDVHSIHSYALGLNAYNTASKSSATILMILIIGLIAGPAVSLYGSPTVSPVIAA